MVRFRFRFTVGRLMVAVAVVGLVAGGFAEYPKAMRRRASYQSRARQYALEVQQIRREQRVKSRKLAQ
jgi:hypothetical protein